MMSDSIVVQCQREHLFAKYHKQDSKYPRLLAKLLGRYLTLSYHKKRVELGRNSKTKTIKQAGDYGLVIYLMHLLDT